MSKNSGAYEERGEEIPKEKKIEKRSSIG